MNEIELRIFVDSSIFRHEYEFVFGSKRNVPCYFEYHNVKTDKCSCHLEGTYNQCLAFARARALDKRYKNFEFLIHLI